MEPVVIDDLLTSKVIGRHVNYFEDVKKNTTFNEILAERTKVKLPWVKSNADNLGFGFKEAVYWVRFSLKNPTRHDIEFYLYQAYPHNDRLSLYVPDKAGNYSVIQTGAAYPFATRPYRYKNFVFPLIIEARSVKHMYLRLDSHGSININLSVVSPKTFESIKENDAIFFWTFYGIFFVMFIFNMFIYFSTGERSYLYYTMYIASFGLFTMSLDGMGFQYLWPDNVAIGKMPIALSMSVIIFSIVRFAQHFINVRKYSRVLHVMLSSIVWAAVSLLVVSVVTWNYWFAITSTNALAGIAAFLGLTCLAYLLFVKKIRSRQGWFFIGSFIFFLLGVIMVVLYHRGILPATVVIVNGIYVGAVFQVITLSLGIADKINSMKNELNVLNTGLEEIVTDRTKELLAANEEMQNVNRTLVKARDALWDEMQLAKKIQTVLLPDRPSITGYEISAFMKPADDVGGDYYDVIHAGGVDWIVIGDVSGHGMPAGLVMMMAQTSINTVISNQPGLAPSEVLTKVNKTLYRNIKKLDEDKYMTITVLAAHREGRFIFSGLHQDILVYRTGSSEVEQVDTNGMWIGIINDLSGKVTDDYLTMLPGDSLLLYTDGITEAWRKGSEKDVRSMEEEMFGEERLKRVFAENARRPVGEIRDAILASQYDYVPNDDVTLLIVRRAS
ncbi:MAG: SpoIIE family protein phosphatase [Spirochaetes bacterium]|nr:SpoIIE family protein phosphatase [Spirochaetota bacterium]